ncbi:potassium-transporting ATPase subunit C [Paracoccus aestuariivivens]|uniref:Potassium-transporting ATPase KdpC subunit n=1 Tax=Paracoccus aestuariivivens TaxID=1820333 RepID=A0A6L6JFC0_9RHOB|nr:potassium-transporting ATPase subunit C [Paracoccus aestuariivivens]MTH80266.1 potassium-transporting ATPase subunit C [Paracoccus aestuariivivens]
MLQSLLASLRITAATMAICVAGYSAAVWAFAQTVTPFTANGSILMDPARNPIGSRQIAQGFSQPGYFWSRPSAVDYNAAGAAGSNRSPTSEDLKARAAETVAAYGATPDNPLSADLAAASGAGLDPHISEEGALYQVPRVAEARKLDPVKLTELVNQQARPPGAFLSNGRIVNVLDLNRALDQLEDTQKQVVAGQ